MSYLFYIPIHSVNLGQYLGRGIIAPSIYIENKNADIQDRFKNYLLVSSSKFTKDTNCAIEIVINSKEESLKKLSDNFYLFDMPLPISRVKNIYFSNEEKKISTNFDVSSGSAFIPDGLLKVSNDESIEINELDNIEYQPSEKNWNEYLKKYDQVMGGFSTMKISKEKFQNYPTHYFSTLGNINDLFSNILKQQDVCIENNFQFAFTDEGKSKGFQTTIYSEIDYNEVQRYAENEKEKVKLEVKNGLVQIDRISENTYTYLVAILERYGKGKRMQIDSFISDLLSAKFFRKMDEKERGKKNEGLSLIFGINKGYKAFRNKYKTSNFEVDIKFHLDSKLDYYIIESIYQNVFNSLNNISSFKYIDDLFSQPREVEVKTSEYVTYQMVDETIIWKQRVLSPIEKLLTKIVEKVSGWFPSFIEIKKKEIESLFKEDVEHLKLEIESELGDKYKAELEQNKTLVENLNNTISAKEKIVNQLENQIKEDFRLKTEAENFLKKDIEHFKSELEKNRTLIEQLNHSILDKGKTSNLQKTQVKESEQTIIIDNSVNEVASEKEYVSSKSQIAELSEPTIEYAKSTTPYELKNTNAKADLAGENAGLLFSDEHSFSSTKSRETELNEKNKNDLLPIAKQYNIQKISKLNKHDLITEIVKFESEQ